MPKTQYCVLRRDGASWDGRAVSGLSFVRQVRVFDGPGAGFGAQGVLWSTTLNAVE